MVRPEGWRNPRRFPEEIEREIVGRYEAGETSRAIGTAYGCDKQRILGVLERYGVGRRSSLKRPLPCREDAFDTITEESAYWIGFLMADGCVSRKAGRTAQIVLGLKADDIGHVERFRTFLGATNEITISSKKHPDYPTPLFGANFRVSSNRLADSLERYGVIPRKSHTAKVIDLEMDRHFWRGVIDGDGWVGHYKDLPSIKHYGSSSLVAQFRDFAMTINPNCKANVYPAANIFIYTTTGHYAWRIIESLYAGCNIALARKREIAEGILSKPCPAEWNRWSHITLEYLEGLRAKYGNKRGSWTAVARELGMSQGALSGLRWALEHPDGNAIRARRRQERAATDGTLYRQLLLNIKD